MDASLLYSITESDSRWPLLLRELPAKARPKKLYVQGKLPPQDTLIVAVVGTRKPTSYGSEAAQAITRALSQRGIVVASGMAIGIDSIAHRAALEASRPTLAILGSGLSERVIYPQEHLGLAQKIVAQGGALISEYEPDQKPELWTFPQRNRIIAGLAKAVVVVEAGETSGALITARLALEYGREVFALPGPIYSAKSQGTNTLLKEGAIPITAPDDVLTALGLDPARELQPQIEKTTAEEQKILEVLDEAIPLDDIIKKTHLRPDQILASISHLELAGIIKATGNGLWRKTKS